MNNKKYLRYLVFMGIFYTFCDCLIAISSSTQSTSQESTATQNTTPQKKQKNNKSATQAGRRARHQAKNNKDSARSTVLNSPIDTQSITEKSTKIEICPHGDIPVKHLNAKELAEVLACTQAQKNELDTQVEKLEELLEVATKEEILNPEKKRKTGLINLIANAPRCPYATTPLKKLKAEQLEEVYAYTQTHKMDAAFTIDLLERLIALSDNHAGVKQYKLQLADKHYELHHIEKAAACYEDFAVMYPGSEEYEYVLYKAVACMFELSLDSDRDQTNTKKTISLIKEFLKHAKATELIQEAQAMLQKCYDRLYGQEVYVFNFYAKKKNFVAAQMRLDYIAKTFTETIANLDKKVADLTMQLELRKNPVKPTKKALANRYLA